MKINADFSKTVIVHADNQAWVPSPMHGVDRKPLDRVGNEVARATSIVRYAPGSHFSPHVHTGGEEFIVLEGVFQDEHSDYPAGTYVRNPPQSSHTPGSALGCTIFVKLWQFAPSDRVQMTALMNDSGTSSKQMLFENSHEKVFCIKLAPNEILEVEHHKGLEILMLEGEAKIQGLHESTSLVKHSWLRQPVGESLKLKANNEVFLWLKQDHLVGVDAQVERVLSVF